VGIERKRVLGVLAGADLPLDRLGEWARSADVVLAADGGADHLLAAGITPDRTIGDLDSLRAQGLPNVEKDTDTEASDCDKLLRLAHEMGFEEITLAGIEGDRLDHVLGTLASAIKSSLHVRLALRTGLGWVVKGDLEIPAVPGQLVSLMPLVVCHPASILGVEWPLIDVTLTPFGQISLSNRAAANQIQVRLGSGAAVLFSLHPRWESPIWP
jgi:thiamine pyrophosphokinase